MPLPVYRLRRILAATAVLLTAIVAGMYFYARSRATNVLKSIPSKIGYDIKQTASGFQFSKSDGKRTLFTVQASDIKEFKLNGNAELHNVSIILYGRDSSRFDQIYGDDFAYNQKTGDITAMGDVQIDLVANPAGFASPDQSTPKELKNPIHLKTRDLIFNKDSGNASTNARVECRTPQATGWAVGVTYAGKTNTLTLASQVHLVLSGKTGAVLEAERGTVTNDPRQIVLEHARLTRPGESVRANVAAFDLSPENHVERVLASGDVIANVLRTAKNSTGGKSTEPAEMDARADEAEFLLLPDKDMLQSAILKGNVHMEQTGSQPLETDAGRVIFDFSGRNRLQKVHALDGARIVQKGASEAAAVSDRDKSAVQDMEMTAPVIDFTVRKGHFLQHASTEGAAQILITQIQRISSGSAPVASPQRTTVTAGKFDAEFSNSSGRTRMVSLTGTPDARIVNSAPGQPDRVSTSDRLDVAFLPEGGIESIAQKGNVAYTDNAIAEKRTQAWANYARYTPADRKLLLTGNPRLTNGAMETSADAIHIDRATGDAEADGNVKSTYSELHEQPDGALLASASPIHVTAQMMTAHNSPVTALYTGNARLWQDANVVEAPSIQFDRNRRFVIAQGTAARPVQTVIVQERSKSDQNKRAGNSRNSATEAASTPITITALNLTYADSDRTIHFEGGVNAKGVDFTASAKSLNAYLLPHRQTATAKAVAGPGQLDHMVAEGDVSVQQQNRRAEGQKLVYTAADDKFVLTGGPPSIFDAEQGKITGVSLTFFRRDDRVLVEGGASGPVVTTTRVAR